VRVGISRTMDLGVTASPWLVRPEWRIMHELSDEQSRFSLSAAVMPYAGWVATDSDATARRRYGLELPLIIGFDAGGVYEAWAGLRLAADYTHGQAVPMQNTRVWAARVGPVLGVGLGFRHVHGLLELSALYEHEHQTSPTTQTMRALVLLPAFSLRFRN